MLLALAMIVERQISQNGENVAAHLGLHVLGSVPSGQQTAETETGTLPPYAARQRDGWASAVLSSRALVKRPTSACSEPSIWAGRMADQGRGVLF